VFHVRRDAGALSYCQRPYRIRNETESRCVVTRPPLKRSAAVGAAITPPASGAVDFQSRNPGESTRVRETVAPQTLGDLFGAADRAGFFGLPARVESDRELCAVTATDHPGVTITVFGATTSAVHYYTGCYIRSTDSTSTSPAPGITRHPRLTRLSAFASAIDSALGSARWVRPAARR